MYNILVCTVFLRSAEESIPPTSVSYFATYDSTYTVNVTNTEKNSYECKEKQLRPVHRAMCNNVFF